MRLVFTIYAINASLICFLLTLALILPSHYPLDAIISSLFTYTYLLFGPLLFMFSLVAVFHVKALALYECSLDSISTARLNLLDLLIVMGCLGFSAAVTGLYTIQGAIDGLKLGLRDEKSIVYRLYMWYLKIERCRRGRLL